MDYKDVVDKTIDTLKEIVNLEKSIDGKRKIEEYIMNNMNFDNKNAIVNKVVNGTTIVTWNMVLDDIKSWTDIFSRLVVVNPDIMVINGVNTGTLNALGMIRFLIKELAQVPNQSGLWTIIVSPPFTSRDQFSSVIVVKKSRYTIIETIKELDDPDEKYSGRWITPPYTLVLKDLVENIVFSLTALTMTYYKNELYFPNPRYFAREMNSLRNKLKLKYKSKFITYNLFAGAFFADANELKRSIDLNSNRKDSIIMKPKMMHIKNLKLYTDYFVLLPTSDVDTMDVSFDELTNSIPPSISNMTQFQFTPVAFNYKIKSNEKPIILINSSITSNTKECDLKAMKKHDNNIKISSLDISEIKYESSVDWIDVFKKVTIDTPDIFIINGVPIEYTKYNTNQSVNDMIKLQKNTMMSHLIKLSNTFSTWNCVLSTPSGSASSGKVCCFIAYSDKYNELGTIEGMYGKETFDVTPFTIILSDLKIRSSFSLTSFNLEKNDIIKNRKEIKSIVDTMPSFRSRLSSDYKSLRYHILSGGFHIHHDQLTGKLEGSFFDETNYVPYIPMPPTSISEIYSDYFIISPSDGYIRYVTFKSSDVRDIVSTSLPFKSHAAELVTFEYIPFINKMETK
jgi:hypothetical protein